MGNTFNTGRLINGLFTDANGNVGIGTTSPTEKLSVIGNIRIDNGAADGAQLVLASSGFSDWNIDNYSGNFRWYYGTTERMRLTNAGNLAVATSSPVSSTGNTRALQIGGSTIIQSVVNNQSLYGDNAYYDGSGWKYATSNNAAAMRIGALAVGDFTFHSAAYATAGSSIPNWDSSDIKMTIKASGNVGIGTSSPVSIGGYTALTLNNATTGGILTFQQNGTNKGSIYNDGSSNIYLGVNSGAAIFETNGSERMRITSGGSVLINRTSNTNDSIYKFIVKNTTNVNLGLGIQGGEQSIEAFNDAIDTGVPLRIYGNPIRMYNTIFFMNYGNGTLSISGNQVVSSSDINLKIDDGQINNALDKVLQLNPRYFYWKENSGINTKERQLGFYAQDVKEALGEEVANDNGNGKWGIYDRGIIAMLTKAIQELSAKVTALENK